MMEINKCMWTRKKSNMSTQQTSKLLRERQMGKKNSTQIKQEKKWDIRKHLSIIMPNGIDSSWIHRLADWIKKQEPTFFCL
jgi:hypothetical protein